MLTFQWLWLLVLLPLPMLIRNRDNKPQQGGHLLLPSNTDETLVQKKEQRYKPQKLSWLIWIFMIIALTRPQWLGDPIELASDGRDLMVAVDLSGSMQIEDMVLNGKTVNRFRLIQDVVGDFIERRKGDRLGLILFADHAYLQAPLTQDRRSVAQFLKEAQIGLVGKQTAICEAIALGVKRFDRIDESNRILVLLTDGSNNAGDIQPKLAAEIAAKRGVTIYTIGVGADVLERRGLFRTEKVNPSKDLDETQLKEIAKLTNGQYFRARNSRELERIYQEIDNLEPVSREQITYRPQQELFYWPLAIALALSLLQMMTRMQVWPQRWENGGTR